MAGGLVSAPGYFTPTEGFTALRAGAHALKLFPAEAASPAVLKAQRAVLPKHVPVLMVGRITPHSMRDYLAAGADGLGSARVSTVVAGAPTMSPPVPARTWPRSRRRRGAPASRGDDL